MTDNGVVGDGRLFRDVAAVTIRILNVNDVAITGFSGTTVLPTGGGGVTVVEGRNFGRLAPLEDGTWGPDAIVSFGGFDGARRFRFAVFPTRSLDSACTRLYPALYQTRPQNRPCFELLLPFRGCPCLACANTDCRATGLLFPLATVADGQTGSALSPGSCSRQSSTTILCSIGPGSGKDLMWRVAVGPDVFLSVPPVVLSFVPPVITSLAGAQGMPSVGGSAVTITGTSFGPLQWVEVFYGPVREPLRYTATNCTLVTVDTILICRRQVVVDLPRPPPPPRV